VTDRPSSRAGTGGVDLVVHEGVLREKNYWQAIAGHYECETARLRRNLVAAVRIAGEAAEEWDKAPGGMRAGKILLALAGHRPGYRADTDDIHASLAGLDAVAMTAGDLGMEE
jgi:hypothetical protein